MVQATEKMIAYAEAIAEELGYDLLNYSFNSISKFISTFKEEYKIKMKKNTVQPFTNAKYQYNFSEFIEHENKTEVVYKSGVYFLFNKDIIIYIGKGMDVRKRVLSSITERDSEEVEVTHFSIMENITNADAHILEPLLITKEKPILNKEFKTYDNTEIFLEILEKIKYKDLKRFEVIKERRIYEPQF